MNGVVLQKSIVHSRMRREIDNPNILLLSNSLGIQKDEEDFFDIDAQIKQEDNFIGIIMKRIEQENPNLIFIEKDASFKAIEALLERNITLVTNVKKSVMQRLERLTETQILPSPYFLDEEHPTGKCSKFWMESIANPGGKSATLKTSSNIITLEGCPPYLGCTIQLSGNDLNELKVVKHAVKKMLRLSRQLVLKSHYIEYFGLHTYP